MAHRETFGTCVAQVLVPALRLHENPASGRRVPGLFSDARHLDRIFSHKAPAIRATRARLCFLRAFSPDLNPIKQVFAVLKHLLRESAERSKETVWLRIGTLPEQFTPQEFENYLSKSGSGSIGTDHALIIDLGFQHAKASLMGGAQNIDCASPARLSNGKICRRGATMLKISARLRLIACVLQSGRSSPAAFLSLGKIAPEM